MILKVIRYPDKKEQAEALLRFEGSKLLAKCSELTSVEDYIKMPSKERHLLDRQILTITREEFVKYVLDHYKFEDIEKWPCIFFGERNFDSTFIEEKNGRYRLFMKERGITTFEAWTNSKEEMLERYANHVLDYSATGLFQIN